jgi:hypothetical protein
MDHGAEAALSFVGLAVGTPAMYVRASTLSLYICASNFLTAKYMNGMRDRLSYLCEPPQSDFMASPKVEDLKGLGVPAA